MKVDAWAWLLAGLLAASVAPAGAQSDDAGATDDPGKAPGWSPERPGSLGERRNPFLNGVRVYLGRTEAVEEDGELEEPSGDATVGVEFGAPVTRRLRWLRYDTGVWFSTRDYENALAEAVGEADASLNLSWTGVTAGLRAALPVQSRFKVHLAAGGGIFRSIASISGRGLIAEDDDRSTGPGYYAGVALDYRFSAWALGLDLRRLWIEASFDAYDIEDADVGGTFLGLTVDRRF